VVSCDEDGMFSTRACDGGAKMTGDVSGDMLVYFEWYACFR